MKTPKGELFTKTTKRNGTIYYVRWQADGKRQKRALKDHDGNPITNRRDARKAADKLLAPYAARNEADRRRALASQYEDALETAEELEREAKPKTPISSMWTRHPWDTNTRGNTERKLAETTVRDNAAQWSKFVKWAESEKLVHAEDVSSNHAVAFRDSLQALSNDRTNKVVLCCKVMFELSGIAPNPFEGLRKLHHKPRGRRELTVEELTNVCQTATGEMRVLLAIGLYSGLRLGDACRLKWDEISADLSRITVDPSKTGYRQHNTAVIPVHEVLAAILSETPPTARTGPVMPEMDRLHRLDASRVAHRTQKHFESCGLRIHRKDKGGNLRQSVEVGYHSLRHSFISISARQGTPLHVVQGLVGHSSPQTQQIYLHASEADNTKAIAALPSITAEPEDSEETELRNKLAELAWSLPRDRVRELVEDAVS